MGLGGGVWVTQNKTLPGAYINFASKGRGNRGLSDRGVVALPTILDFGEANKVVELSKEVFIKDSLKILGYDYTDSKMVAFRELFAYATKVYLYRMLADDAIKADNKFASAKYAGTRGNDIKIIIKCSVDDNSKFDVLTSLGTNIVHRQTVKSAEELRANDFVDFKNTALEENAGLNLSGGTNGSAITGANYTKALGTLEAYNFNILVCEAKDSLIAKLFETYTKRLRDEVGAKFQCVLYKNASDYEGVISLENSIAPHATLGENGLIYWLAGASAGCEVNKSLTNKKYDGELEVVAVETRANLEDAIKSGKFVFHSVNGDIRVLEDINTLVTTTDTKGEDFKSNQTMRVLDQIANDIASLFGNNYVGKVPNDNGGRIGLWNAICDLYKRLETLGAIEDFKTDDVVISEGENKKSVVCTTSNLKIVNAMSQLYMAVVVV